MVDLFHTLMNQCEIFRWCPAHFVLRVAQFESLKGSDPAHFILNLLECCEISGKYYKIYFDTKQQLYSRILLPCLNSHFSFRIQLFYFNYVTPSYFFNSYLSLKRALLGGKNNGSHHQLDRRADLYFLITYLSL